MKKIILILIVLLTFTACQNSKTNTYQINVEEKAIITKDGKNIFTNKDLFNKMLNQDTLNLFLSNIVKDIYELEKLPSVDMEAEKLLNEYKETLGDAFKTQLLSIGFSDEESFLDSIKTRLITTNLTKEFVKLTKEEFLNSYHPTKIQYVVLNSLDDAKKVEALVKQGIEFENAVSQNNFNTISVLVTEKTETLPVEVKSRSLSASNLGLSEIIEVTGTNDTKLYYLVNVIDNDPKNFEEEALNEIVSHVTRNEVLKHYFSKYNVQVYEQNLYEQLEAILPGVIK